MHAETLYNGPGGQDDDMGNFERSPSYEADLRAIAEALDEAGAPRKIGTLSLNLVERVDLLARNSRGAVARIELIEGLARLWLASPSEADQVYGERLRATLDGGQ